MPQLNVETFPSLVFWLLMSFGFLYISLKYAIVPKISGMLEARQKIIDTYLNQAEASQKKALDLQQRNEHRLKEAYQKEQERLDKKNKELVAFFKEEEKNLMSKMTQQYHLFEKDLQRQEKKVLEDLEKEFPTLMTAFIKKISDVGVTPLEIEESLKFLQKEGN